MAQSFCEGIVTDPFADLEIGSLWVVKKTVPMWLNKNDHFMLVDVRRVTMNGKGISHLPDDYKAISLQLLLPSEKTLWVSFQEFNRGSRWDNYHRRVL